PRTTHYVLVQPRRAFDHRPSREVAGGALAARPAPARTQPPVGPQFPRLAGQGDLVPPRHHEAGLALAHYLRHPPQPPGPHPPAASPPPAGPRPSPPGPRKPRRRPGSAPRLPPQRPLTPAHPPAPP